MYQGSGGHATSGSTLPPLSFMFLHEVNGLLGKFYLAVFILLKTPKTASVKILTEKNKIDEYHGHQDKAQLVVHHNGYCRFVAGYFY